MRLILDNTKVISYLIAYPDDGPLMEYRTTDYEEVFRFKKLCKEKGIKHIVRFRKPEVPANSVKKWWQIW